MKFTISAASIAAHIPGQQRSEGKKVSAARVRFMLKHPEQGGNRARLISALIALGLTEDAAERYVDNARR